MSEANDPEQQGPGDHEEPAATPFDGPYFLPAVLGAFALWFAYDGWFNPDMEWILFNRVGAGCFAVLAAWLTFRALRGRSEDDAAD